MPTIDQAVEFLMKNGSLELGESAWPTLEEGDSSHEIDWDRMFPQPGRDRSLHNGFPYGDNWQFQPTDEELSELESALGISMPNDYIFAPGQQPQWDLCAWYQPIHFFGYNWGIYIKEDCVKRTAMMIARFVNPAAVSKTSSRVWFKALYRAAVYLYFLHEHYHHKVECLGFRLQVVQRRSAYGPYHKLVYAATSGTDDQLEEALANADCYHRLGSQPYAFWLTPDVVNATKAYLRWEFPQDPPGYRRAVQFLTKSNFDEGENFLQAQVNEARLTPVQHANEWDLAPRMTQSFFPVTTNIWTVVPVGTTPRLPLRPVAPVRTCSTEEMVELYRQAGYLEVPGGKGSHVKLQKPDAPTMILSGNRRELSPGVAKTALRVLGDFNLHDLPDLIKRGLLSGRV